MSMNASLSRFMQVLRMRPVTPSGIVQEGHLRKADLASATVTIGKANGAGDILPQTFCSKGV